MSLSEQGSHSTKPHAQKSSLEKSEAEITNDQNRNYLGQQQQKVSNTFKVVALYPYKASSASEISFELDDIITVTDAKTYKDWWSGSINNSSGLFPMNYVERINEVNIEKSTQECDDFIAICKRGGNSDDLERMYKEISKKKKDIEIELARSERRSEADSNLERTLNDSVRKYYGIMNGVQRR